MEQFATAPAVFSIRLRSPFRGITAREGVVLTGPAGWGEFSPFDNVDVDAASWRSAYEAAYDGWPEPVRMSIPVNVTIGAVGPEQAAQLVFDSGGCRTAKVKVAEPGQTEDEEIARVEAVVEALGPGGNVRIDANGLWDVDTAIRRVRVLDRVVGGLEYVEQPCATLDELAAVRRAVDVPIAADESIRYAGDPRRVIQARAADIAVLKVAPLGGVQACLRLAEECRMPVVVSSMLETSVGLAAGIALAAALPELPYACGLATAQLLEHDVTVDSLTPVEGELPVRQVEPDNDLLAAAAPDELTARRWLRRLSSASSGFGR